MTDKSKLSLSYICTSVAFIMAITSGMILCACPGWPAIGVGFAIGALFLRRGAAPLLPMLALVGSLVMTGGHLWEKLELPGSHAAKRRVARAERASRMNATNSPGHGLTTVANRNP